MGKNDKPKPKKAPAKELSEAEMRNMGMSEEQIADIMSRRGLSAEDKKKQLEEEERKRHERDAAAKEAKRKAEEEEKIAAKIAAEKALEEALKRYAEQDAAAERAIEEEIAAKKAARAQVMEQKRAAFEAAQKKRDEENKRLEEQLASLSPEERATRKKALDEAKAVEDAKRIAEFEAMKTAEFDAEDAAEAKAKRAELIKAKKLRAKEERARLVAMGMMTQEEADVADGRLDEAYEADEKFSAGSEQAKMRRVDEKMAAKMAEKSSMKSFKQHGR